MFNNVNILLQLSQCHLHLSSTLMSIFALVEIISTLGANIVILILPFTAVWHSTLLSCVEKSIKSPCLMPAPPTFSMEFVHIGYENLRLNLNYPQQTLITYQLVSFVRCQWNRSMAFELTTTSPWVTHDTNRWIKTLNMQNDIVITTQSIQNRSTCARTITN